MIETADVVIIGGGVIGASIAYHLTELGCRDVVILERECQQGLGSTGRATGGFRGQFSTPINIRLSLLALETFRSFREATGVDPHYRPNGYLLLATTGAQVQALREMVAMQQREGLEPVRMVSRAEIAEIVPLLFTDDVGGGSFCPVDGLIEPLNVLRGFTKRALERGATMRLETAVRGIEVTKGAVHGVLTDQGAIATGCVVNASGAWARPVAALAGIELPVEPLRRQVAGTQPLPVLPDETPMVIEVGSGFHFRKDHSGGGGVLLLWNDPAEPYGERLDWEISWLRQMIPMARRRLPALAETMVSPRRCWAGLYEMTPDRHPILGPAPGVDGLYLANGFSGHGVMHSPAVGRLVAEQILYGEARTLDISELRLERFAEGRLFGESGIL